MRNLYGALQNGPMANHGYNACKTIAYTYDMGGDATGLNPGVALDAYSFTLHYFYGDYDPINTARLPFAEPSLHANLAYRPLYNGNISSMGHSIPLRYVNQLYNYKYDQLNRLVEMDMYRGLDGTNKWSTLAISNLYHERYKYDGNGNIKTVLRNGHLTANPLMDSLTYFYTGGTNRLDHIRDRNVGSTTHSNNYAPAVDIKDQAAGNYSYDAIGNLKSSEWMGDDNISWNVYGKVVEVEKRALAGVTSRFLHYYYDPSGNKTGETVRHGSGGTAYYNHRWYVRDAQGNVLATYEVNNAASASAGTLKLREHHLYACLSGRQGSSRLGIINRDQDVDANKLTAVDETNLGDTYLLNFTRGNKLFELTNHLGNVLTVLSDKKMGRKASDPSMIGIYDFDMVTASDYTPFGMVMQGRNFSFLSRYRYGFNGKEYDNEFKGAGNLLDYGNRLYDPLAGRFMSVDPITSKYPMLTPYQFASNTPIQAIDLDGLEAWVVVKTTIKDKTYVQLKFDKDLINEGGVYYVHRWMDPKTAGFVASESSGSVGYSEYPQYFPNFANGVFDAANFTNFRKAFSIKGEANILFAEAGLEGKLGGVGLGGSFGGNGKLIGLNVNTDDATGSVPFAGWQSTFRENDQTLDVGAGVSYGAGISYRHKYDLKKDKFKNQNEIGYNGLVTSGTIDGYSEKSTISFGVGGKAALGFGVNFEGKFVIDMDKLNKVLKARGIQFTQYEQVQQNSTEKGKKEFDPNKY